MQTWRNINLLRHSLFGHVRRMDQAAPAHQALHLSVMSWKGSGQFDTWRRQPGRQQKCWVEQVTTSTGLSSSVAWSVGTDRSAWRERVRLGLGLELRFKVGCVIRLFQWGDETPRVPLSFLQFVLPNFWWAWSLYCVICLFCNVYVVVASEYGGE